MEHVFPAVAALATLLFIQIASGTAEQEVIIRLTYEAQVRQLACNGKHVQAVAFLDEVPSPHFTDIAFALEHCSEVLVYINEPATYERYLPQLQAWREQIDQTHTNVSAWATMCHQSAIAYDHAQAAYAMLLQHPELIDADARKETGTDSGLRGSFWQAYEYQQHDEAMGKMSWRMLILRRGHNSSDGGTR